MIYLRSEVTGLARFHEKLERDVQTWARELPPRSGRNFPQPLGPDGSRNWQKQTYPDGPLPRGTKFSELEDRRRRDGRRDARPRQLIEIK